MKAFKKIKLKSKFLKNFITLYENRCVIWFFFIFFVWSEERVQRVFKVIKVNDEATKCVCVSPVPRKHTNYSIYKHIAQLDEKTQIKATKKTKTNTEKNCSYTAANGRWWLGLPLLFFIFVTLPLLCYCYSILYFLFTFSRFFFLPFCFDDILIYIVIEPLSARSIWNVHMFIACKM